MSKKNKLKIGITGGIGSGKTTVCHIFESLGIPVYYADERAKYLITHQDSLKKQIIDLFGTEAYHSDGTYNRPFIANIVFNDKSKLTSLNNLVHPAVQKDADQWHEAQQNTPYTLKEAALLYESGNYKHLDKIISVFAPESVRLERLLHRDKSTIEAIKARMASQMPENEKIRLADFVIYNDGNQSLIQQVIKIHRQLCS